MPDDPLPAAWCEIDLARIARNLDVARGLLPPGARFCAVLKADAYGHGIARVVPVLRAQGVQDIGITSNAEARAVRRAGFTGTLMRLRTATPAEMDAAEPDLVQEQIGALWAARHLQMREADSPGVHLALNAGGMSRDGLDISTPQGARTCREILERIGTRIVGISTHFADNTPDPLARASAAFARQVAWVRAQGPLGRAEPLIHAGSTLTLLSGQPVHTQMYRCGAILYGILGPELGFRPTLALKARVVHLGRYPAGARVGYDGDHRLDTDRDLACISIGYASGYRRSAQDRGTVLIRGRAAPVLGKVSMNSIVADVTELGAVEIGDVATVFGDAGPCGAAEAPARFGTIVPDLLADWGMRNPRVYR